MTSKIIAIVLIIAGVIIGLFFVFADQLGIGQSTGFGYKQIIGIMLGVVIAILGVWRMVSKPQPKK